MGWDLAQGYQNSQVQWEKGKRRKEAGNNRGERRERLRERERHTRL